MVKSLKQRGSLLMAALVLVVGVSQVASYGTASAAAKKGNANSIKVSPLRTDITVKPGTTGTVAVYVTNVSSGAVTLKPIENDFVAGDEKGTPAIILDQNSYAPTHSLKRFMLPLKNISLNANQTKKVNLKIKVPITAQAGGYFGALRFAPASTGSKPVSLNASVASLVLMTVPGPTAEKLALTNFDVQQDGNTAGNFRTPKDLILLVRFKNEGNKQEAPFGQVQVLKGKKVLYSYNFNQTDPKDEVLPDSARRWEVPLKNLGKFGKYTVSGTFGYGNGQTVQVSKTIWIIPTSYIIGAIVIVVGLILLILLIRFFLKSYKRRILRSYHRPY